jgi:hypothetical protein
MIYVVAWAAIPFGEASFDYATTPDDTGVLMFVVAWATIPYGESSFDCATAP